jgi:DsbC/DsbD-like thiol-disulfide interchange protein
MKKKQIIVGMVAALVSIQALAFAQKKLPEFLSEMKAAPAVATPVKPGATGKILLTVKITPEYHLYGPKNTDGIPTEVTMPNVTGLTIGKVQYPGKPTDTYKGETTFTIPFTVAKTAKKGAKVVVMGTLKTQACTETSCLPPVTLPFKTTIEISK